MKGMYICNRFSVEQRRMIKFIESIENWQRIDDLSSKQRISKTIPRQSFYNSSCLINLKFFTTKSLILAQDER